MKTKPNTADYDLTTQAGQDAYEKDMHDYLAEQSTLNGGTTGAIKVPTYTAKARFMDVSEKLTRSTQDTAGNAVEREFYQLSFETPEGEPLTMPVNANFWDGVKTGGLKKRMRVNGTYELTIEKRTKGVTQYKRPDGTVAKHTSDSESLINAKLISEASFVAEHDLQADSDINRITGAGEFANPVMEYLRTVRSAKITATAKQP